MADVATLVLKVDASGAIQSVDSFASSAGKASDAGGRLESVASGLKDTMAKLGLAIGAVEIIRLANDARETGERYEALGAIMQQMSTTLGISTTAMVSAERAMQAVGATSEDARASVVKLLNAHIDLANAANLQAEAQNLAAKEGISERDAMDALILAIQTGMERTLKHAGVLADFTKATRDAANATGVSTDQFSQQQLEQIRLQEVLKGGTAIQGAYAAQLQTGAGQAVAAKKALADLRLEAGVLFSQLAQPALEKAATWLRTMADYARDNPAILVKIKDVLVSIAEAVGLATAAWILYEAAAVAAAAKTALIAGVEVLTGLIELAKTIRSVADATALFGIAMDAVNPAALLAAAAAVTAAFIAWKKLSSETGDEIDKMGASVSGLGGSIKTTGTQAAGAADGLQSSAEALKRLLDLRRELPALIAGLQATTQAYDLYGKGAGTVAERQAALSDAIAKGTVGLVGQDAAEMKALLTRQATAQWNLEDAKSLRSVIDTGDDAIRSSEQQAVASRLVGDAAKEAAAEFQYQNAVIAAQRDLFGDAQAAAISYAGRVRDAQLDALHQINAAQPFQNLIGNAQNEFSTFFGNLVNSGVTSFQTLADQVRGIFASLVSDLARMFFEKKIAPSLGALLGIGGGSAVDAAGIVAAKTAGTGNPTMVSDGNGNWIPQIPASHSTASGSAGFGQYVGAGAIGLGGLATAYGIGATSTNPAVGAVGGAAAGALSGAIAGSMIAPGIGTAVGAIVGGLAGLVSGLLGSSSKIKQVQEDFFTAEHSFVDGLKSFPSDYAQKFADIEKSFSDLQAASKKAKIGVGSAVVDAKNAAEAALKNDFLASITQQTNDLSGPQGQYINQLNAIQKAYQDNLATVKALGLGESGVEQVEALRTKSLEALKKAQDDANRTDEENLQLRQLQAAGNAAAVRQLQEQMEVEAAQAAQKSDAYVQELKHTQALEDEAAAQAKAAAAAVAAAQAAEAATQRYASLMAEFLTLSGNVGAAAQAELAEQQRQAQVTAAADDASPSELALLGLVQLFQRGQLAAQQAAQTQTDLLNQQLKVSQSALTVAQSQLQAVTQAATSLKSFSDTLKTSAVSPLSPLDQLNAAKSRVDSLYTSAQGGNATAASQFGDASNTYLQLARNYYASSSGYADIFNSVSQMSDTLSAQYANEVSLQQQTVDALTKQIDLMQQELAALQDSNSIAQATQNAVVAEIERTAEAIEGPNGSVIDELIALGDTLTGVAKDIIAAEQAALVSDNNAVRQVSQAEIDAIKGGASAQQTAAIDQLRLLEEQKTSVDDGFAEQIMTMGQQLGFDSPVVQSLIQQQHDYDANIQNEINAIVGLPAALAAIFQTLIGGGGVSAPGTPPEITPAPSLFFPSVPPTTTPGSPSSGAPSGGSGSGPITDSPDGVIQLKAIVGVLVADSNQTADKLDTLTSAVLDQTTQIRKTAQAAIVSNSLSAA